MRTAQEGGCLHKNVLCGQAQGPLLAQKCPMRAAPGILLAQNTWTKRAPTFRWIVLPLVCTILAYGFSIRGADRDSLPE